MANNDNIDKLREQGWNEMSSLLDTHMPAGKNRPVIWWYWLAGAAALALFIAISWPYLMNENSLDNPTGVNQEMANMDENNNIQSIDPTPTDQEEISTNPANQTTAAQNLESGRVSSILRPDVSRGLTGPIDAGLSQTDKSQDRTPSAMGFADKNSTSREKYEAVSEEVNSQKSQPRTLVMLDLPDFQVSGPQRAVENTSYPDMSPTEIKPSGKRLKAFAFTEMMWSLSDQFGFLNAGPGLEYDFGKWAFGASAGIGMPLPRQKSFNNSNQPFSKQYNFSQKLANEAYDFNSAVSGNVVYYENYTMKPGFKFDVFVRLRLSARWNIGIEAGRIGYEWDFTQKAVPNLNIAANTDLTDLKNELWYGGLTTEFTLSKHWGVKGGLRFINPGDPENIGVLPNVRMEYKF